MTELSTVTKGLSSYFYYFNIKFRRRRITQKKAYNIQNTAKVWNQESFKINLQLTYDHVDVRNMTELSTVTKGLSSYFHYFNIPSEIHLQNIAQFMSIAVFIT